MFLFLFLAILVNSTAYCASLINALNKFRFVNAHDIMIGAFIRKSLIIRENYFQALDGYKMDCEPLAHAHIAHICTCAHCKKAEECPS